MCLSITDLDMFLRRLICKQCANNGMACGAELCLLLAAAGGSSAHAAARAPLATQLNQSLFGCGFITEFSSACLKCELCALTHCTPMHSVLCTATMQQPDFEQTTDVLLGTAVPSGCRHHLRWWQPSLTTTVELRERENRWAIASLTCGAPTAAASTMERARSALKDKGTSAWRQQQGQQQRLASRANMLEALAVLIVKEEHPIHIKADSAKRNFTQGDPL
jgi:hypothetical protein